MFAALHERLDRLRGGRGDEGIGLVEVLIALLVFSIVAVGMSLSLGTVQRLTSDNENREVAANLASASIDDILAVGDPFQVGDNSTTRVVAGVTYTVKRSANWQRESDSGNATTCGSGSGNLLYRSYNISVTWSNQFILKNAIQANTILAPQSRINDPDKGTIIVSAYGADGTARAGVGVSVTPRAGGSGVSVGSVPDTDSDGCSYVLQVEPGEYQVALSKTGFLDTDQNPNPKTGATFGSISTPYTTVGAGTTTVVAYEYDRPVTIAPAYRNNALGSRLPDTMDSTWFGGGKSFVLGTQTPVSLHAFRDPYAVVAGKYTRPSELDRIGCTSVDSSAWAAGTAPGGKRGNGLPAKATASAPGTSGTVAVPMGVVTVQVGLLSPLRSITARSATSTYPGDPGCSPGSAMSYKFSSLGPGTYQLALPYGSWTLTGIDAFGGTMGGLDASSLTVDSGRVLGTVVTLDPRPSA